MKVSLTRENKDNGTESLSTCDAEMFINKIKSETKGRYVSGLRAMLEYAGGNSGGFYEHIDRALGRKRPRPGACRHRPLQQPALARIVLSLVSQYGGALAGT